MAGVRKAQNADVVWLIEDNTVNEVALPQEVTSRGGSPSPPPSRLSTPTTSPFNSKRFQGGMKAVTTI